MALPPDGIAPAADQKVHVRTLVRALHVVVVKPCIPPRRWFNGRLPRGKARLQLGFEGPIWPVHPTRADLAAVLEDALAEFAGCAVIISHDRWFLDRISTHILAFEGDGYVHWCEGNFQIYESQRKERLGKAADEPHHFRYKKLKG